MAEIISPIDPSTDEAKIGPKIVEQIQKGPDLSEPIPTPDTQADLNDLRQIQEGSGFSEPILTHDKQVRLNYLRTLQYATGEEAAKFGEPERQELLALQSEEEKLRAGMEPLTSNEREILNHLRKRQVDDPQWSPRDADTLVRLAQREHIV